MTAAAWSLPLAAALVTCGCGSGGGPSDGGVDAWNNCGVGWPAAPALAPPAQALAVTPGVLWTKDLQFGGIDRGGVALAGDKLVVSTGYQVQILAQDGTPVAHYTDPALEWNSAPTADGAGNVYVVTHSGVHSFDSGGNVRWNTRFPGAATMPGAGGALPPILSPDGTVYASSSDGRTWVAVDGATGTLEWSQSDGGEPVAGAGLTLVVSALPSARVFDLTARMTIGQLAYGNATQVVFDSPYVVAGYGALGYQFGVVALVPGGYIATGTCGGAAWSLPDDAKLAYAGLIGQGELLITLAMDVDASGMRGPTSTWSAWDATGVRRIGPVTGGPLPVMGELAKEVLLFAGADGTTYSLYCDGNAVAPERAFLIAHGADLTEGTRIDLGTTCPKGTGVLTDGGIAYLTRAPGSTVEVVAVQTVSPGLANSSWPTLRHDNRGTSWLTAP